MSHALIWRKSRRCANAACVEVAVQSGTTYVRDSKDPGAGFVAFTAAAWTDFLAGVKTGRL